MNTVKEVLIDARARYASAPSHTIDTPVPEGTYCMVTAVQWPLARSLQNAAFDALRREVGGYLIEFNAAHSTDDVLAAFDGAIATAEAEA